MISHISPEFRQLFGQLPNEIQAQGRKAYKLFQQNPKHPSLHFKKLVGNIYSARIFLKYRTVGILDNNEIVWFWIGSHTKYDKLVARLRGR
jgi:hypothetical protein